MKTSKLISCALMVLFAVSPGVVADTASPLVVYRGEDGKLTDQSKINAVALKAIAAQQGYVTLWITANTSFNPFVGQLTDTEIAEQNARVLLTLDTVLQPLIDAGQVWHPSDGPIMKGPGCLIRARTSGVARLVKNSDVLHIVATE